MIGIIGVLSSITIVSYKDYSEKARISNGAKYDKSIHMLL